MPRIGRAWAQALWIGALLGPLFGCGQDSAPAAGGGEPRAAEEGQRLIGSWVAADLGEPAVGEVALRMQQGIARGALRFEFRPQGRVVIGQGAGAPPEDGSWEVLSAAADELVIRITTAKGEEGGEARYAIVFQGRDRFTMRRIASQGDEEIAYTFTRIRA